ncbi:MAG: hypothetical protein ACKVWR_02480 [Acidimicrobiales bacterium]
MASRARRPTGRRSASAAAPPGPARAAPVAPVASVALDRAEVERWFLARGLPHLIHGYGAASGVLNRAIPLLVLVFLVEAAGAFNELRGWRQAGVVAASGGILLGVGMLVNRLRGRRLLELPDRIGALELAAFVLAPAATATVFGRHAQEGAAILVGNVVLLLVAYLALVFGVAPMARWALAYTLRQLGSVVALMARSLPVMLLVTTFLFLNAELWQVANDFRAPYFALVAALLFAVGLLFLLLRAPREIAAISEFRGWREVVDHAGGPGSPLPAGLDPDRLEGDHQPPLTPADQVNVMLVILISLGVQIALVQAVVGMFFVVFGLFAVREETIRQWTTVGEGPLGIWRVELFGGELVLTRQLLFVVGFLVAFAGLQVTVAALNDSAYREQFFRDVTAEIRQALAVRAVYLRAVLGEAPDGAA